MRKVPEPRARKMREVPREGFLQFLGRREQRARVEPERGKGQKKEPQGRPELPVERGMELPAEGVAHEHCENHRQADHGQVREHEKKRRGAQEERKLQNALHRIVLVSSRAPRIASEERSRGHTGFFRRGPWATTA